MKNLEKRGALEIPPSMRDGCFLKALLVGPAKHQSADHRRNSPLPEDDIIPEGHVDVNGDEKDESPHEKVMDPPDHGEPSHSVLHGFDDFVDEGVRTRRSRPSNPARHNDEQTMIMESRIAQGLERPVEVGVFRRVLREQQVKTDLLDGIGPLVQAKKSFNRVEAEKKLGRAATGRGGKEHPERCAKSGPFPW
jgi:hypothetical protein